jgi:hypothetical protein
MPRRCSGAWTKVFEEKGRDPLCRHPPQIVEQLVSTFLGLLARDR